MADLFKWVPVNKPTCKDSSRFLRAQFGDGYEQTTGDGINSVRQEWSLQFAGNGVEDAYQFLKAKAGWQSFQWKSPDGELLYFRDGDINRTFHGTRVVSFTTTFTQVFKP